MPAMIKSIPVGKLWSSVVGVIIGVSGGMSVSHCSSAVTGSCSGYVLCRWVRRCDAAAWASGLESAHA